MSGSATPAGRSRGRAARHRPETLEDGPSRSAGDSWLGGITGAPSEMPSGWEDSSQHGDDSRFMSRQVRRMLGGGDTAQRRIHLTYLSVRIGLGLALVVAQLVQALLGNRGLGVQSMLTLSVSVGYACLALVWWIWPGRRAAHSGRWSWLHWWATIGVDTACFATLHWLDRSASLNYGALLVLPVLMAGVFSERMAALATAAAVSLALLGTAGYKVLEGGDPTLLLSQSGLAGIGLFVIALLAGQMSARLAREERAARGSLQLAHQQVELNRLVIDELTDGVLVVDRRGRVRAANPAARALLADDDQCPKAPFSLADEPGWRGLLEAVQQAYEAGHWPANGQDITVSFGSETPRSLRVRARFTRGARLPLAGGAEGGREVLAVLFAEELRSVLARQRQERLVAMGRISAGIAHEIRNPLAAVAQANALMQEDVLRPDQQRLVRIIGDNVERLKRIVNDVLEAAPGGATPSRPLDAGAEVAAIASEWAHTNGLVPGEHSRLQILPPPQALGVLFDSDHLRRVLVNLLDNALRHSTQTAGAVLVSMEALEGDFVRLSVASDGALIAPEVEPHLFEPFHSTRSRGTGLGLYICRELCVRHGAIIDYVQHPGSRHGNVFLIVMRRVAVPAEGHLHL